MEIREITGDKRRYLPLLLVGDEQEEMVMRYLPHGSLFVCFDPDPCAVAVVTDEGDGCCELKNLAGRGPAASGRATAGEWSHSSSAAMLSKATARCGSARAKRPRHSASTRSAASAPQAASTTFLPAITTTRSSRRASCCAT